MKFAKTVTLSRPKIELVPVKNWRERLQAGDKPAMTYHVRGVAVVDGVPRNVSFRLPGLDDYGIPLSFGTGRPYGVGEQVDLLVRFCPVNARVSENGGGLQTAVLEEVDGKVVVDANGIPTYLEAPVLRADGTEADLRFGTLFFVPTKQGLTLTFEDVTFAESEGVDKDDMPYLDAIDCGAPAVVPAASIRPSGGVRGWGAASTAPATPAAAPATPAAAATPAAGVELPY